MVYWVVFAIAMFAGIAMTVREGIWSNAITLVNIIISGLVSFGFYSTIVVYLDEDVTSGQHTYWLDFAILWGLFCAAMVISRSLTGAFSKTKLRFKNPIDPIGGPIVGILAAWVLASFTPATLHASPMPKNAFSGKLVYDAKSVSGITQPDAAWLRFFEAMSQPDALGTATTDRFSAKGYVDIYGDHREKFEKAPTFLVKRGGT